MGLPGRYGWPNRHLLGQPEEMPWSLRHAAETMLLTCTCGTDECWPLIARVQVTDTVVVWSAFRNVHRDGWDLSTLGPFTFSRADYEQALRRTQPADLDP
jgi:hypothetical protein